jgi:hypothetical protein
LAHIAATLSQGQLEEIYAERVFHDRQLCGYIAELIVTIGFDGAMLERDEPQRWMNREVIPEWAKKALSARERGKCALCSADISAELEDDTHIDHIVPLYLGGSNDLVNLQMLCKQCNLRKSKRQMKVRTSIPSYMQRRLL